MRVRMKEAKFEDLFQKDSRSCRGDILRHDIHPPNPFEVVDRNTLDELHGRSRSSSTTPRIPEECGRSDRVANWSRQRCMVRRSIVKSSSRLIVRSNSRASIDGLYTASPGRWRSTSCARFLMMSRSAWTTLRDIRPTHLEGHGPAVAKKSPVDLRNRGGGDRNRIDRNEDFGKRDGRMPQPGSIRPGRTKTIGRRSEAPPVRSYRTREGGRVWC